MYLKVYDHRNRQKNNNCFYMQWERQERTDEYGKKLMEESNKPISSLSIWLLHFSVNKILLTVESLIVESPVKTCSLKDFLTLFTSQNQKNNDIPGKIYFSFVPGNGAKDVCARNCS